MADLLKSGIEMQHCELILTVFWDPREQKKLVQILSPKASLKPAESLNQPRDTLTIPRVNAQPQTSAEISERNRSARPCLSCSTLAPVSVCFAKHPNL